MLALFAASLSQYSFPKAIQVFGSKLFCSRKYLKRVEFPLLLLVLTYLLKEYPLIILFKSKYLSILKYFSAALIVCFEPALTM